MPALSVDRPSPKRFVGTIEQLARVVSMTAVAGTWEYMPAAYWRYVCVDGAILNWWPSSKTFNLQGPAEARDAFEQRLIEAAAVSVSSRRAIERRR